jgi:hypothetical protein
MGYGDVVCSTAGRRLIGRRDLWIGRHILVEALRDMQRAVVQRSSDGSLYWKHGTTMGTLAFEEGTGWVSTGSYDMAVTQPLTSKASRR